MWTIGGPVGGASRLLDVQPGSGAASLVSLVVIEGQTFCNQGSRGLSMCCSTGLSNKLMILQLCEQFGCRIRSEETGDLKQAVGFRKKRLDVLKC